MPLGSIANDVHLVLNERVLSFTAIMSTEKTEMGDDVQRARTATPTPGETNAASVEPKKPWWNSVREAGSATQIVIAAALAIGIGLGVSSAVDEVPKAATTILAIPGRLWLRALKAVGMWLLHPPW